MPRVDFYILPDVGEKARRVFAARLALKAFRQRLRIVIRTPDTRCAQAVDADLWSVRGDSFLAHDFHPADFCALPPATTGRSDPPGRPAAPVLVADATTAVPDSHTDLLINLCEQRAGDVDRFDRVAEIFGQDGLSAGRALYRYYRQAGWPLHHHEIGEGAG